MAKKQVNSTKAGSGKQSKAEVKPASASKKAPASIQDFMPHLVVDPESHDRLDTLFALEVISRAGDAPKVAGKKKVELTDSRKQTLEAIAKQLKREIKYVKKFL